MTKFTLISPADAAMPLRTARSAPEPGPSEPERRPEPVPSLDAVVEGVLLQLIHGRRAAPRRTG